MSNDVQAMLILVPKDLKAWIAAKARSDLRSERATVVFLLECVRREEQRAERTTRALLAPILRQQSRREVEGQADEDHAASLQ